MKEPKTIRGLFSQTGFVAESKLHGVFGDKYARVIRLKRLKKQEFAPGAGGANVVVTTNTRTAPAICQYPTGGYISNLSDGEFIVRGVTLCL